MREDRVAILEAETRRNAVGCRSAGSQARFSSTVLATPQAQHTGFTNTTWPKFSQTASIESVFLQILSIKSDPPRAPHARASMDTGLGLFHLPRA